MLWTELIFFVSGTYRNFRSYVLLCVTPFLSSLQKEGEQTHILTLFPRHTVSCHWYEILWNKVSYQWQFHENRKMTTFRSFYLHFCSFDFETDSAIRKNETRAFKRYNPHCHKSSTTKIITVWLLQISLN